MKCPVALGLLCRPPRWAAGEEFCPAAPNWPWPSTQVALLPPAVYPGPGHLPDGLPGTGQALQVSPGLVSIPTHGPGTKSWARCRHQREMRAWPARVRGQQPGCLRPPSALSSAVSRGGRQQLPAHHLGTKQTSIRLSFFFGSDSTEQLRNVDPRMRASGRRLK